ncbi:MAG TPA: hypothetical protein VGD67_23750 [Pseudonocardiaceae bacterium]
MAAEAASLVAELKKLRKGRGIHAAALWSVVGPALREVCEVRTEDQPAAARKRVADRLVALSQGLPKDLAEVVRVALALEPDVHGQFLHERIQWLAQQQDRDIRTIRRRVDAGLTMLAEAAAQPVSAVPEPPREWRVRRFETLLRLDQESPVCEEQRVIVAERDGLDTITFQYTIPRTEHQPGNGDGNSGGAGNRMHLDVRFGARLLERERVSCSRFRFVLGLPRPLAEGEEHTFGMTVRLPAEQPMRPHYLYVPERPCEAFELRVRFPDGRRPRRVERVDGAFHRDIDEVPGHAEAVVVDGVNEAFTSFGELVPRLGYGLRWSL